MTPPSILRLATSRSLGLCALFACAFLPVHAASLDDLGYTTTDGEVTITNCNQAAAGELVIPDTIEGNPVTRIGDFAFVNCTSLTSITIPDGVTSIGFAAFRGCSSLTSITIPDSVTSIGDYAFMRCSSLTSITIGAGVISIGDFAFYECSKLTSITIPDGVTSIGLRAFNGCTALTSITIGNSVTSIGGYAFSDCSSLTSITIPDGVTSMTSITFRGNAPTFGIRVFDLVPANARVFIYEGASGFNSEDGKFLGMPAVVQKISNPPKIISVVGSGDIIPMSSLIITFTSGIGSNYAIERSRDLVNWVTLLVIAGEESSTEFTDNEPIHDGGGVFYRIREGQ